MIDWLELKKQAGPVKTGISASRRIHGMLVAAIESGILTPGTRLKESEIVKALDVSRTPLREVLAGLRAEGIVESDGSGLAVRQLGWQDIRSFYAYRGMLESMAAGLAATHAHKVERTIIEELCAEESDLINSGADATELAKQNRRFHHAIHQASSNTFLLEGLERLNRMMILIGPTAYGIPPRVSSIAEEHQAITAAISASDADGAESAMRFHISNALRVRLEWKQNDA